VAVLDARAAAFFWPDQNPLGQRVADFQVRPPVERQVIGVVRTIDTDFGREPRRGSAFVPFAPSSRGPSWYVWRGGLSPATRDGLAQLADEIVPGTVIGTRELRAFERRLGEPRLLARLMLALAILTVLLTVAGVYATVSHTVSRQTPEIGVRLALGAAPHRIRHLVVKDALLPVAAGVAGGAFIAAWSMHMLESLLFGFTASDPTALAAAASLVLFVAVAASAVPATRASRIDPAVVLRES
jgi:predicted lysophospholipase L1 biosynthesis ABC-type transport system permease subunit